MCFTVKCRLVVTSFREGKDELDKEVSDGALRT